MESSRLLYTDRAHWRVWDDLQDADYLAVCCSYCHRVRTKAGAWGAIPSSMYELIHETSRMNLSHGICPDCQRIMLGARASF